MELAVSRPYSLSLQYLPFLLPSRHSTHVEGICMALCQDEAPEVGALVCQGAEGKVYCTSFLGLQSICKERLTKRYRIAELDTKINKQRLIHESRCLAKCLKAGIPVPSVYFVDVEMNRLYMERIVGSTVKQHLWNVMRDDCSETNRPNTSSDGCCSSEIIAILSPLAESIGKLIARMHESNIVHGDLTTSNMMIRASDESVVFIDFGLGSMKPTVEDKAVDLYVLERAFLSTHAGTKDIVNRILEVYRESFKAGQAVFAKFEQVRQRGRKRDMVG